MKHSMTIRTNWNQIFNRINNIVWTNLRYWDYVMNMNKLLTDCPVCILKIEPANLARERSALPGRRCMREHLPVRRNQPGDQALPRELATCGPHGRPSEPGHVPGMRRLHRHLPRRCHGLAGLHE